MNTEKLPPHSEPSEAALLGCIMLDPKEVFPELIPYFIGIDAFYDARHRALWDFAMSLYETNPLFDTSLFLVEMGAQKRTEACGGLVYVAGLPDLTPSAANWKHYAVIVRDNALRRRLIGASMQAMEMAYDHAQPISEILDKAETSVMAAGDVRRGGGATLTMTDYVRLAIDRMERKFIASGKPTGFSTGYPDVDKLTLGLHRGEVTVIAARPSGGKTTLGMNLVEHLALDQKEHVCIVSLEMSGEALVERMIYSRSKVASRRINELTVGDMPAVQRKLVTTAGYLAKANIHIIDQSSMSIIELRSKLRALHRKLGFNPDGTPVLAVAVIDYLQLLHSTSAMAQNRAQEISDISRGIKNIAKELKIAVILLSQLNRDSEKLGNRRPRLADLKESSSIEQDAHNVAFIWDKNRPKEDEVETGGGSRTYILIYEKQREGPRGDVELFFNKEITRFDSAAKIEPEPRMPYA